MRREGRLVLTALLALVAAAIVLAGAPQPARAIAGLALTLVLPGAAVVGLVTRRRPWPAELTVLSVASSLSLLVVGGLLLDRLGGLDRGTWTVGLACGVAAAAIVALLLPQPRRIVRTRLRPRRLPAPPTRQLTLLALAASVAAVAVGLADASQQDASRGTPLLALWTVKDVTPKGATQLRIGVDARAAGTHFYRLELRATGESPTVFQVPVRDAAQWRLIVDVPPGGRRRVDALLYDDSKVERVLRRTSVWVP